MFCATELVNQYEVMRHNVSTKIFNCGICTKISSGDIFNETESIVTEHGPVRNRRLHLRLSFSRILKSSYRPDAIRTSRRSVSRTGTARYKSAEPEKNCNWRTLITRRTTKSAESIFLLFDFFHITRMHLFLNKIARFIFG